MPGLNPSSSLFHALARLADLMEQHQEELATIEALDAGAVYTLALKTHVGMSIQTFRYFAGWCDKIQVGTRLFPPQESSHRQALRGREVRGQHMTLNVVNSIVHNLGGLSLLPIGVVGVLGHR